MLSAAEKMQVRAEFAYRMMLLVGPDVFEPREEWLDVQRDFMAGKLIICRRFISGDGLLFHWEIES